MKLILPLGGKGTRMRPITHTLAKPLVPIAGKPTIQHIIDSALTIQGVEVSEIIFITGYLGHQIEEWAKKQYPDVPLRFIEQTVANGSADAIRLAEPHAKGEDALIIFCDTLFDADLEVIGEEDMDGAIWTAQVPDPRRFGVVYHDEEMFMTDLVEKPDDPDSDLVNIGMYYIRDTRSMFAMIDVLYQQGIRTKGEYNFPEALALMAKNGKQIKVHPVEGWYDTGVHATTLATNKVFCEREGLENGVHATAIIEQSTLFNCIVMEGARIIKSDLKDSIIGPRSIVKHTKGQVIVGADCVVDGNDNRNE